MECVQYDSQRSMVRLFHGAIEEKHSVLLHSGQQTDIINDFSRAVVAGLDAWPRQIPCRFLYDERGSQLYESITQLPEYYLTRTEASILAENAMKIRKITGPTVLMELGSGNSSKTKHIFWAHLAHRQHVVYIAVDVSRSALEEALQTVSRKLREVQFIGINSTYEDAFALLSHYPAMCMFLGSTLGNFSQQEEQAFWKGIGRSMRTGDHFLLGVDLDKDPSIIEPAYNDAQGVTAQFTKNLFRRMNRELGSEVDLDSVEHVARYDDTKQRIEIFARFTRDQTIHVRSQKRLFKIAAGEMIHTEISRKFDLSSLLPQLSQYGFETVSIFTDPKDWYALLLLQKSR